MTEVQKEILIAKMLDSPSCLSDEEVDIILHDDEIREMYEVSAAVSGSIQRPDMVLDMDDEWSRFRARSRRKDSPMRWIIKVAAIISGIICVSLLAGILIFWISPADKTKATAKLDPVIIVGDTLRAIEYKDTATIPAEAVMPVKSMAKSGKAPRKKAVSGQDTIAIDIDEYLRIQQAAIDNEIALQTAQVIKEEYEMLAPEFMEDCNTDINNTIKILTVQ